MADQVEGQERREVVVDSALAALYGRRAVASAKLDSNKLTMAHYAGLKAEYVTRNRREVRATAAEIVAMLAGMLADGKITAWNERGAREALAKREALLGELAAIDAEAKPLNEEFAANPWSRFFLVHNHGGHIHSSMNCSTCRPTTAFGWLPQLSGLTEEDAVAAHGPLLCTVCYPSAPVEWTMGLPAADDKCPGSGEHVENPSRRRYIACPHCGKVVNMLNGGRLRAHKKEA